MLSFDIIILKSDVLREVEKTTLYTGGKTETANQTVFQDRVATTDKDADLLQRYWRDACAHLVDTLRAFITAVEFGQESLKLTLEAGSSYDTTLTPAVENGILYHLSATITARWFAITFPDRAAEWRREALNKFECILANLYHHRKPVRK